MGAGESDLAVRARTRVRDAMRVFANDSVQFRLRRPRRAVRLRIADSGNLEDQREGLAAFYGIRDAEAVRFFSVHEKADVWHRQVEREALGRVARPMRTGSGL
jgi:hypothetical protein